MVVNVRVAMGLRRLTGGIAVVQVKGDTVGEAIASLGRQFPDIKAKLQGENGQLSGLVGVYVDGENISYRQGLDTPLAEGNELMLLPAAAGG
jgi:molybdopterin converting factor small subunit